MRRHDSIVGTVPWPPSKRGHSAGWCLCWACRGRLGSWRGCRAGAGPRSAGAPPHWCTELPGAGAGRRRDPSPCRSPGPGGLRHNWRRGHLGQENVLGQESDRVYVHIYGVPRAGQTDGQLARVPRVVLLQEARCCRSSHVLVWQCQEGGSRYKLINTSDRKGGQRSSDEHLDNLKSYSHTVCPVNCNCRWLLQVVL